MIENLVNQLVTLIDRLGYVGVFTSMFIESFFAPIPSELILPFAGFSAANGNMDIIWVVVVAGIASYLGSLPFYFLGYWGNDYILNKFIGKYGKYLFISQQEVDKGFEIFDRFGTGIVLAGRLIPIIRTVISFPAGLTKMNFFKFSLYTISGSMVWSGFLASAGYLLGDNWESVSSWVSKYEHYVLIVGILLVLAYIGYQIYKRVNKDGDFK